MPTAKFSRGGRPGHRCRTLIVLIGLAVVAGAGCGASVGRAQGAKTAGSTSVPPSISPHRKQQHALEKTKQDLVLEQHLVRYFAANGGTSHQMAKCFAQETLEREGGVAGLAKLGIDRTTSTTQLSDAFNQMLQDRTLTTKTEPFDRLVDGMFTCGIDKQFRTEFMTQLRNDGNSPTASACLTDRVLGDRYLRLVLVVGQQSGTTEDPRVKTKFEDPLVAAVDRAAHVCGVISWGGS